MDTKVKQVKDGRAVFKDKFQMKTPIDIDPKTGLFLPKLVLINALPPLEYSTTFYGRSEGIHWRNLVRLGKICYYTLI